MERVLGAPWPGSSVTRSRYQATPSVLACPCMPQGLLAESCSQPESSNAGLAQARSSPRWNCHGPPSATVPRPRPSTTKGGACEEVPVCAGIAATQEIKSALEQSALNTRRRGSMLQAYDYAPAFNHTANEANSARPIHHSSSAQIPDSGRVTAYAEV